MKYSNTDHVVMLPKSKLEIEHDCKCNSIFIFILQMGAKKMGAQKVAANFEELEQKAETIEKEREMSSRLVMEPTKTEQPQVNKLVHKVAVFRYFSIKILEIGGWAGGFLV